MCLELNAVALVATEHLVNGLVLAEWHHLSVAILALANF